MEKAPGKAIAALILGIASLLTGCGGVGLICAIVDLVLCSQLSKEYPELPKQAKVGKVLGIIGLILGIIGLIVIIAMAATGAIAGLSSNY
ncbi:putative uncharacterized protein [Clostridium sp. CAG:632]|jgi:hypothetical protein|nr:hypothetical protein [Clostridium sp.]CCY57689.1 putative uncharacterized protein [Clostridium sp. CAG:632]